MLMFVVARSNECGDNECRKRVERETRKKAENVRIVRESVEEQVRGSGVYLKLGCRTGHLTIDTGGYDSRPVKLHQTPKQTGNI